MLYVDTSVLVALCTHEEKTESVIRWYQGCKSELASAVWCVTEFSSALSRGPLVFSAISDGTQS